VAPSQAHDVPLHRPHLRNGPPTWPSREPLRAPAATTSIPPPRRSRRRARHPRRHLGRRGGSAGRFSPRTRPRLSCKPRAGRRGAPGCRLGGRPARARHPGCPATAPARAPALAGRQADGVEPEGPLVGEDVVDGAAVGAVEPDHHRPAAPIADTHVRRRLELGGEVLPVRCTGQQELGEGLLPEVRLGDRGEHACRHPGCAMAGGGVDHRHRDASEGESPRSSEADHAATQHGHVERAPTCLTWRSTIAHRAILRSGPQGPAPAARWAGAGRRVVSRSAPGPTSSRAAALRRGALPTATPYGAVDPSPEG